MSARITASIGAAALALAAAAATPQAASAQEYGHRDPYGPRGDYQQLCRNISERGNMISAYCPGAGGRWQSSTINRANCRDGRVEVVNGVLACANWGRDGRRDDDRWDRRDDRRDDRWDDRRGGRGRGIVVYEHAGFQGRSMSFRGAIVDLRETGMNDRISSMEVRGTWLACSDSHFRGQCRTFTGRVYDLRQQGFNDRISSLRPAGGGRW
ncbi:beta/gamma crystallin-related protein [Brevundimonas sp. 2R-24]|uniref:Beta/gamma crystallin-related protein n=1 Tax=Peiella sedimenti TaxID=3061083 RepID=A0ABT8SJS3_9CAUL|nr:beta/gamma crystallin-related protein [Caulobacteraceae bacterium XZ-24]